jgi:hypothetical protein
VRENPPFTGVKVVVGGDVVGGVGVGVPEGWVSAHPAHIARTITVQKRMRMSFLLI